MRMPGFRSVSGAVHLGSSRSAREAELKDGYDTERQWLSLACTRARDVRRVRGGEPASEELERRANWGPQGAESRDLGNVVARMVLSPHSLSAIRRLMRCVGSHGRIRFALKDR